MSHGRAPIRRPQSAGRMIRENVNEAIHAREVRASFPDGSVEILPTLIAISKARNLGLDLVLIAPEANPPIARVMDYGQ
jgi:translation initiation factor IF-3